MNEFEEKQIDVGLAEIITAMANTVRTFGTIKPNYKGIQQMSQCYEYIRKLFEDDSSIQVSYRVDNTLLPCGIVNIEGTSISFKNALQLKQMIRNASTVEVCGHTNGILEMSFSFDDIISVE